MKKKAVNTIMENLVFILLILIFAAIIGVSVSRIGSNTALHEQVYSKEISLIIDRAEPGTEIEIDMTRAYNAANKNKYDGNLVSIDNNENKVNIKLINGRGYDYYFFNDLDIIWDLKKEERKLSLKFMKNE